MSTVRTSSGQLRQLPGEDVVRLIADDVDTGLVRRAAQACVSVPALLRAAATRLAATADRGAVALPDPHAQHVVGDGAGAGRPRGPPDEPVHGPLVVDVVGVEQGEQHIHVEQLAPDEGVAEFLDLPRVRPNPLGNTRMLWDGAWLT